MLKSSVVEVIRTQVIQVRPWLSQSIFSCN